MTERCAVRALQRFLVVFGLLASWAATAQSGLPNPPKPAQAAPTGRKSGGQAPPSTASTAKVPKICPACIRAEMNFLASDALRGRGSGTPDELLAATYVGAQLEQWGIEPAGDRGTYIQRASVVQQKLTAPPQLKFMTPGDGIPAQTIWWTHGKEMIALELSDTAFRGTLRRVKVERGGSSLQQIKFSRSNVQAEPDAAKTIPGSVVLLQGKDRAKMRAAASTALAGGAVAVLEPASAEVLSTWDVRGEELPKLAPRLEGGTDSVPVGGRENMFALNQEALASLNGIPDGTMFYFEAQVSAPEKSYTWNAVGRISGSDPALSKSAILLSAHLDHLGIGKPVNGDSIYNGADDDASGTVAVLELARVLASAPKPKRTVLFALFGSEEQGGLGVAWFEQHPPLPCDEIAANLEFEMIGRPDPKYPPHSLWLSGWERSNLGPMLAAHGAKLVPDARPEEHFFQRSDNYVLAKKGVVAQTASSFGLHADYHQPSDELEHIDFKHMDIVIGWLIAPLEWLVNSDFRPRWNPGERP